MRQMGRVEPLHRVGAKREHLAIGDCARHAVGQIFDRDRSRDPSAQWRRIWSSGVPQIREFASRFTRARV
jgi:hypothetical protein